MIQLITEGPQIPEEIERALRNDNLVFFCGAGISVPNGLPLFNELVKKVCSKLNVNIDQQPLLKSAKDREDYAGILDLLEGNQEFSVQPKDLRKEIINILSHDKSQTDIHNALLELSVLPGGGYRLVTTNFDRLFFKAGLKPQFSDSAPKLSPPRKEIWKNLTFLHGVIDTNGDPEGENLIFTKKDFGLAYLHDNWASRFIIQLFQNFTVLFVGYSINDPVMNYLVSAISYEKRRRNETKESGNHNNISNKSSIYAFAGYEGEDEKEEEKNQWKSIGVEPILYKVKDDDHSVLYETLKKWAELKKTGLTGRKIWLKEKLQTPYKEGVDKEKAETVISTLKIDEKLAEYLPKINLSSVTTERKPVDISWLKAFSEEKKESKIDNQNNNSLLTSKVNRGEAKDLLTKLTRRTACPSSYSLWEPLSVLEKNIAKWLCRHLDKTELIYRLIKKTTHRDGFISLHPEFKSMLKQKIDMPENPDNNQLDERKVLFWRIVTTQIDYIENLQFYDGQMLIDDLNENYSYAKVKELLFCLEPQIGFKTYFYNKKILDSDKIYEAKLSVKMNHYPSNPLKNEIVLQHAEDWTNLLKKSMELAEWAGLIENGFDSFFIERPSIDEHEQNKDYYPWTYLIDLTRDSFDLAMNKNKKLADLLLNKWRAYPYPVFYRLILYAVTKHSQLSESIIIDLLKSNKTVLWSTSCRNEFLRYLSYKQHAKKEAKQLLFLIREGPDRSLYKESIDENYFAKLKERSIYQRLNRLRDSKIQLPADIEAYYNEIKLKYNISKKTEDSDNFPIFFAGWRKIGSEKHYHNRADKEIFDDIKDTKPNTLPTVEEKKEEFRSFFKDLPDGPDRAFEILSMFQDNDLNSAPYWEVFIFEASMMTDSEKSRKWFLKSFEKVETFNDDFFKKCLWSLIHGFNMKGGLIYHTDKEIFKKRWKRLWDLSIKDQEAHSNYSDASSGAVNSHLGKLSELIFHILRSKIPYKKIPKNDKIPKDIKEYFKIILQGGEEKDSSVQFHFGSYLSQLWYLDREWTIKHLKPLMGGNKQKSLLNKDEPVRHLPTKNDQSQRLTKASQSDECARKAVWQGYLLLNIFLGPDFLEDFKKEFFDLFLDYKQILTDNNKRESLMNNIALVFFAVTGGREIKNIFSEEDSNQLIKNFDLDILESLSQGIWDILKNTETNKSAVLWSDKIKPWMEKFWPQQKNKMNHKIAENLSFIILHCGNKLPEAFLILKNKIEGIITKNSNFIVDYIIDQAGLDNDTQTGQSQDEPDRLSTDTQTQNYQYKLSHIFDYPDELLQILNWNFPEDRIKDYRSNKLKKILDKLKTKHSNVEEKEQYKKLIDKMAT